MTDLDALCDESWTRLDRMLEEALALEPDARAAYLAQLRAGAPEDAQALEQLLAGAEETRFDRSAWEQLEAPRQLQLGQTIDVWRITEWIGAGGMGEVYKAERIGADYEQEVALKISQRGLRFDEDAHRFKAERKILAWLNHPNITQLIDGGLLEDGRPYMVMRYVDGIPIDSWCRALPRQRRLQLFVQVCSATHYAHQRLVIHRDIKPSNILVTPDGHPVLLDFGVAKLLEGEDGQTRTGSAFTPGWAAPEQLAGQPATTATDIYALGLLLYFLLTEEKLPPTSLALPAHIKGDLRIIMECALARDPQERYGSAAALAEDLQRHLSDRPLLAPGASPWQRLRKRVRQNRWPLALAGVLFTGALGYGAMQRAQTQALRAREAARDRAATQADQIARFMVELLRSANPERGEFTIAELLDDGARRMERELGSAPEVRSAIAIALAEAQLSLGRHQQAQALLKAPLQQFPERTLDGETRKSWGHALLLQSQIHFRNGEPQESRALAERSLALCAQDPTLQALQGRALEWLGTLAQERFEFPSARAFFLRALNLHEAAAGPASPEAIRTSLRVAEVFAQERDETQKKAWLKKAQALLPKTTAKPRELLESLKLIAHLSEDPRSQTRWQKRTLDALSQTYGEHHPEVAGALNDFALALEPRDPERAIAYLERALRITEAHYGEQTPRTTRALLNLGSVLRDAGRLKEAAPHLERALSLARAVYPLQSPRTAWALTHLSQLRHLQGRLIEAKALGQEAIERLKPHAALRFLLGVAYYRSSKIERALGSLDLAERALSSALPLLASEARPPFAEAALSSVQLWETHKLGVPQSITPWLAKAAAAPKTTPKQRALLAAAQARLSKKTHTP